MEGIQPSANYTITIREDAPAKVIFGLSNALYGLLTQPWPYYLACTAVGFWDGYWTAYFQNQSRFTRVVLGGYEARQTNETYNYAKRATAVSALFIGFQYNLAYDFPGQGDDVSGMMNALAVGSLLGEETYLCLVRPRQQLNLHRN